jgi:hypothetical protein
MRIILGLAAGMAAIAIGTAAAARPGAAGPGQSSAPTWSYGSGRPAAKPGPAPSGVAWIGTDRRRDRRHGRFGGRHFHPYAAAGIAGPVGAVHPYGSGFFGGGGGQIRLRGGQPYFDYDRAYPYEWAPAAGSRLGPDELKAGRSAEPRPRCTLENSVRVCRGW